MAEDFEVDNADAGNDKATAGAAELSYGAIVSPQ